MCIYGVICGHFTPYVVYFCFFLFIEIVVLQDQLPLNILHIVQVILNISAAARCKSADVLTIAQEVKGKLNSPIGVEI